MASLLGSREIGNFKISRSFSVTLQHFLTQIPYVVDFFSQISYIKKSGFCVGDFHLDPLSPLKVPEGSTPCPKVGAKAGKRRETLKGGRSGDLRVVRAARGDFQNPRTGRWGSGENSDQKPEFVHIFFHVHNLT